MAETSNKRSDIGNEIIPRLYIGNMNTAQNKMFFIKNNIGAVLNLTPDVPNFFACPKERVEYMRISLNDSLQDKDIQKMYQYFPCILNFIHKNLVLEGKSVLVHCHAGVQRSATAVAAYIMKIHKMDLPETIQYITTKRPVTFNQGKSINFKKSLLWFYTDLKQQ
jgi:dual specificity phosphatase 12